MIVVATADFEVYHEAVAELRERGVQFTTIEPDDDLPAGTKVVITGENDEVATDVSVVRTTGDECRQAVEEALALMRSGGGRTIVGIDPGERPGIAVLNGEMIIATFHVPLAQAAAIILKEIEGAVDPLVRIGDGARLQGAKLIDDLDGIPIELVDETGTTPYLGTGARGMGDVIAAINIAHLSGERVTERTIEPTAGELQVIKNRSREQSDENRTIGEALARRVATGELTLEEALVEHKAEIDRREN
ncbi:hypothetical protein ACFQH3_03335 [Haladaptatus sp. GCM10025707]|uniref:hypothetical protein n=1 Tax=unclassified Haladaptatus TaxID=2622732 RepID=UPI0023E86CA8|nr:MULTISPECIES: hypothetical protein [unclassified Haladaptatus]